MKRLGLFAAGLLLAARSLFSSAIPIAVLDLEVRSPKAAHADIGRAFAELIAVELARSGSLRVLDRKARTGALEDSDSVLAGLPDLERQATIGRLLAARYVASGQLWAQGGAVSVELFLVDVRAAQVSVDLKAEGNIEAYADIAQRLAEGLRAHLGAPATKGPRARRARKPRAAEEALIAFGEALAHYDRNEDAEARRHLARARKLDSRNAAVLGCFDRLTADFPVFQAAGNPAYLGILQHDQWFAYVQGDLPVKRLLGSYCASRGRMVVGYSLPVGDRLGVQLSLSESRALSANSQDFPVEFVSEILQDQLALQGGFGWAVSEACALGLGLSLGWQFPRLYDLDFMSESWSVQDKHAFPAAFALGVLLKNRPATVRLDLLAEYSLARQYGWESEEALLYDEPEFPEQPFTLDDWTRPPLYLEANLALALEGGRVLLSVKQANDLYLEKANWTARLVPAVELKLTPWAAFRIGLAGSLYLSSGAVVDHGFRTGWYLEVDGILSNQTLEQGDYNGLSRTRGSAFIGAAKRFISRAR
jgi:TolB-like protein